jgi:hypothetical protein
VPRVTTADLLRAASRRQSHDARGAQAVREQVHAARPPAAAQWLLNARLKSASSPRSCALDAGAGGCSRPGAAACARRGTHRVARRAPSRTWKAANDLPRTWRALQLKRLPARLIREPGAINASQV